MPEPPPGFPEDADGWEHPWSLQEEAPGSRLRGDALPGDASCSGRELSLGMSGEGVRFLAALWFWQ